MIKRYACFKPGMHDYGNFYGKYNNKVFKVLSTTSIDISDVNTSNTSNLPDELICVKMKCVDQDNCLIEAYSFELEFGDTIRDLENYMYLS